MESLHTFLLYYLPIHMDKSARKFGSLRYQRLQMKDLMQSTHLINIKEHMFDFHFGLHNTVLDSYQHKDYQLDYHTDYFGK